MYRITIFITALLLACSAQASDWQALANDAGTGEFLMHTKSGWQPGVLLGTQVNVDITGPVAEVTLTQRFKNPSGTFAEGVYVYPLPDNAALHGMVMLLGNRRIHGEIHKKAKARHIYRKAKRQGKRTALVEQLDPGVFNTSVANIPPGEVIKVKLEYTQVLERDGAKFSLHLPLTITPRYAPGPSEEGVQQRQSRVGGLVATSIRKAAKRTRQMKDKMLQAHMQVELDPGLPITGLTSPSHAIHVQHENGHYTVKLADGAVPMDKDFVLSWQLQPQAHTTAAFLTQTVDGRHYGLLMMMPPQARSEHRAIPKEQILMIDQSGSMSGGRIEQARKSIQYALRQLDRDDRFNVIAFNSRTTTLFPEPVPASRRNVQRAQAFVDGIEAKGGTEIKPALRKALEMKRAPEHVHQIILATDAAVTNGQSLLALLHNELGNARLFPVAIGDAPNTSLLRGLARFGHGVSTHIQKAAQVTPRMKRLLGRIARPMLTGIRIHLPDGIKARLTPGRIPDLYSGQPLIVAARISRIPETITVTGRNPSAWKRVLQPDTGAGHKGVARLWAQKRIETLMDRLATGASQAAIRPRVVHLALRHHLVTRYTSFVAVAEKRVRNASQSLKSETIHPRLPKDMQTPGRGFPDTALDTWHELTVAAFLALLAGLLLLSARLLRKGGRHDGQ